MRMLSLAFFPGLEEAGLNSDRRYASKVLIQSFLKYVRVVSNSDQELRTRSGKPLILPSGLAPDVCDLL
ncbi:MAG: hypothetical protein QOG23_1802 [Blastocatellia bacterium]|jgi:hypothetical protein|nr:hypothetical protein [Blastocatellia bacterium]